MKLEELAHFLEGQFGFRRIRQLPLKHVWHALVQVQLDGLAGGIQCLILPDKIAQKYLFCSPLNQRRWEPLRVVSIDGRDMGVLLVLRIGVGGSRWPEDGLVEVRRL